MIKTLSLSCDIFRAYNITMHTLNCLQIRSSGGPMPQTTIDYAIDNPTVATVGDAGLIVAKVPGNATVTGKVGSLSVL